MALLNQKVVRIGVVAVFLVLMVFGLAMMGSVLGAKPQDLPVALVVLDKPADLPTGGQLAMGEMVKKKVTGLAQLPVSWRIVGTEQEALDRLQRQEVYGALVLPADFSAGVMSLQSPAPKPGVVKLYVNEGMNAQAATTVKTILQQVVKNVSGELSRQVLGQIGQHMQQIPVGMAQSLLSPFQTEEVVVHPVGSNNGGGSAPNMLIQTMWLGSMVMSVFLFLGVMAAGRGERKFGIVSVQTVVGLVLTGLASAFLVWMASSWYGMAVADGTAAWLFLWVAGAAFFLLQSALFNWLGIPAAALLVLLLFFSMPLLNMAPEFMPQATQDWLYSWTPFRYAASGLRNILYFGGSNGMSLPYVVLSGIAGVSLVVLLASPLRTKQRSAAEVSAVAQPQ